jgi:chromatin structure-remodeling complex subunit RSC1/2
MSQTSPVPIPSAAYQSQMNPQMYQPNQRRTSSFVPQTPAGYQASPAAHPYPAAQPSPSPYAPYSTNRLHTAAASVYNPNAPRPVEVFHLVDAANAAIPEDIRKQFHCDERGHVLFFSAPPLDIIPPSQPKLGHSLKYLAAKEERRKNVAERKRKLAEDQRQRDEEAKRHRADEETALAGRVEALVPKAIESMLQQVSSGTDELYKGFYQGEADSARAADLKAREGRIQLDVLARQQTAQIQAHSINEGFVNLKGTAMYLGDN